MLENLVGTAALIAIAGWLLKTFIGHRLDSSRAEMLHALSFRSSEELEQIKSQLSAINKRAEITESWLHQRRAGALEDMYAAAIQLQSNLGLLFNPIFGPKNPADIRSFTKDSWEATRNFLDKFKVKRIYLDRQTCDVIEKVFYAFESPTTDYLGYLGVYDDHELNTLDDVRERGYDEVRKSVAPAVEALEHECRRIFGVSYEHN